MKKISFGLDIGLVGSNEQFNQLFLEYLKPLGVLQEQSKEQHDKTEHLTQFIVFDGVPIKVRIHLARDLNDLIYKSDKINKIDALILLLDLYEVNSKERYKLQELEEFIDAFNFKGSSMLVGFDPSKLKSNSDAEGFRISRYNLIQKAKELDVLYCFEIQGSGKDFREFCDKLFGDHVFKFAVSNPELLEQAKQYGAELLEKKGRN